MKNKLTQLIMAIFVMAGNLFAQTLPSAELQAILDNPTPTTQEVELAIVYGGEGQYNGERGGKGALPVAKFFAERGFPNALAWQKMSEHDTDWSDELIMTSGLRPVFCAIAANNEEFTEKVLGLYGSTSEGEAVPKERLWILALALDRTAVVSAWKQWRSTLSREQQIAVTQQQKDQLIMLPDRTPADEQWLTQVSADLLALKLDL